MCLPKNGDHQRTSAAGIRAICAHALATLSRRPEQAYASDIRKFPKNPNLATRPPRACYHHLCASLLESTEEDLSTKLLYLHGPPAAGKRTVAEAIVRLTAGRLFDNHVAVDFARTILEFDAPGFWDLVHAARLIALEKGAEHGIPLIVYTSCYSHPEDLPLLEDFERVLARHGGAVLPVYLACSRETLEERVGAADRVQRRKVTSKEGLDRCLSQWNLVPVPRPNCFTIHTDTMTPSEAAEAVVGHFGLDER
jgi:hypothetical protein